MSPQKGMHIACAPDVVLVDRCGELVGSSMIILLDIYGRCLAWLFLGFGSLQQASTCFTWKANMLDVHLTQEIIQQVTCQAMQAEATKRTPMRQNKQQICCMKRARQQMHI